MHEMDAKATAHRESFMSSLIGTAAEGASSIAGAGGSQVASQTTSQAASQAALLPSLASYAAGDPDSLFLLSATSMGLEPTVARAVLASSKGDKAALRESARELARLPAISVDPDLVECVLELLETDQPATQKNALKKVATAFVSLEASGQEPAIAAALRRLLTPALFEAIASLGAGRPNTLIEFCRAKQLLPAELQLGADLLQAVLREDSAGTIEALRRLAIERVGVPPHLCDGLIYVLRGSPNTPLPPSIADFARQTLHVPPIALLLVLASKHRQPLLRHVVDEVFDMLKFAAPETSLEPELMHALVALVHGTAVDERTLARLFTFEEIPSVVARTVFDMSDKGQMSDEGARWFGSRIDGMQGFEVRAIFELAQANVPGGDTRGITDARQRQEAAVASLGPALDRVLELLLALAHLPVSARPIVRAIFTLFGGRTSAQIFGACAVLALPSPLPNLICLARGLLSPLTVVTPRLKAKLVEYCGENVTSSWLVKHKFSRVEAQKYEEPGMEAAKARWLGELGLALRTEPSTAPNRRVQLYGCLTLGSRFPEFWFEQLVSRTLAPTHVQAHLIRSFCMLTCLDKVEPSKRALAISTVGKTLQVSDLDALEAFIAAASAAVNDVSVYAARTNELFECLGVSRKDITTLHTYVADIRRDTAALLRAHEAAQLLCARTGVPEFLVRRLLEPGEPTLDEIRAVVALLKQHSALDAPTNPAKRPSQRRVLTQIAAGAAELTGAPTPSMVVPISPSPGSSPPSSPLRPGAPAFGFAAGAGDGGGNDGSSQQALAAQPMLRTRVSYNQAADEPSAEPAALRPSQASSLASSAARLSPSRRPNRGSALSETNAVARAIEAMVTGSTDGVGMLDDVVGMPAGECELLFALLGRAHNTAAAVEKLPVVIQRMIYSAQPRALLPAGERASAALHALGAFAAGYDFPLLTAGGQRPTQTLAALCHVPPAVLVGLLATLRRDRSGCRAALLELAQVFEIHVGVLEGLISLAIGELEQVELLADLMGFDADLAEALSVCSGLLAPGKSATHSVPELRAGQTFHSLSNGKSLQRLCNSVGLPSSKVAALLALACGDYASSDECIAALGLRMHAPYLRAICAIGLCARTLRADAPKVLMVECAGLLKLYGVNTPLRFALLLCLAQGNVHGAIDGVKQELGWSTRDTAVASALALLSHPLPVVLDPARADESKWMEQRNALVAADVLAGALGAPSGAVRLLVGASRKDTASLEQLGALLSVTRHVMWRLIQELAGVEPVDDGDDSEQGEAIESASAGDAADAAAAVIAGAILVDDGDTTSDGGTVTDSDEREARGRKSSHFSGVELLVSTTAALIRAFPPERPRADGDALPVLSLGTVGALLTLPWGCESADFVAELGLALKSEQPDTQLDASTMRTLIALSAHNGAALEQLERERWQLSLDAANAGSDVLRKAKRAELARSLFSRLGCSVDSAIASLRSASDLDAYLAAGGSCVPISVQLALGLAAANGRVWQALLEPATAKPIALRIHTSPRLLRALTLLSHADGNGLNEVVLGEGGLAELTRMPGVALRNVLAICVPCEATLEIAIAQLAQTMGVQHSQAMAFVAGASRDRDQQASMLHALFKKTGIDESIGLACFRAMRFRELAWVRLGHAAIAQLEMAETISAQEARVGAALLTKLADFAASRSRLSRADVELLAGVLGVVPTSRALSTARGLEAAAAAIPGAAPVPADLVELESLLLCVLHIAANRVDALRTLLGRVLRVSGEDSKRELLRALLSVFRRGLDLVRALPIIDLALANAHMLPPGSVNMIFGAANSYFTLASEGVEMLNASGALTDSAGGALPYIHGSASLLVAVMRRSALGSNAWEKHRATFEQLVQRFAAPGTAPPAELCRTLLSIVSYDGLPRALAHAAGMPPALVDELVAFTDPRGAGAFPNGPPELLALIQAGLTAAAQSAQASVGAPAHAEAAVLAAEHGQLGTAALASGADAAALVVPLESSIRDQMMLVRCITQLRLPIQIARGNDGGNVEPNVKLLFEALKLPNDQHALLHAFYLAGTDPTNVQPLLYALQLDAACRKVGFIALLCPCPLHPCDVLLFVRCMPLRAPHPCTHSLHSTCLHGSRGSGRACQRCFSWQQNARTQSCRSRSSNKQALSSAHSSSSSPA